MRFDFFNLCILAGTGPGKESAATSEGSSSPREAAAAAAPPPTEAAAAALSTRGKRQLPRWNEAASFPALLSLRTSSKPAGFSCSPKVVPSSSVEGRERSRCRFPGGRAPSHLYHQGKRRRPPVLLRLGDGARPLRLPPAGRASFPFCRRAKRRLPPVILLRWE